MSARTVVTRALAHPQLAPLFSQPLHIVAAGKAASAMATAAFMDGRLTIKSIVAIGTHREADMPAQVEWIESAHPIPDSRSLAAGERVLTIARGVRPEECLVLLLSGGASALMALPLDGVTLEEKQSVIHAMMHAGADIHALNTVRKHFSAIKGGRLAEACRGTTLTLAISDVVGDDVSVIGSGPGIADASTWSDTARALSTFGAHSNHIWQMVQRGLDGELPDTPKPGSIATSRAHVHVIASRGHALRAARGAAEGLGYHVVTMDGDVTGEARHTAPGWFARAMADAAAMPHPVCILSAGETTVRVVGSGRGGRNQEFVLALVRAAARTPVDVMVASVGTDGIDGPTDAAGALVDRTTLARATAVGLDSETHLADNNAYDFFALLGDLIHLGRTDTNVGDIQVLLQ